MATDAARRRAYKKNWTATGKVKPISTRAPRPSTVTVPASQGGRLPQELTHQQNLATALGYPARSSRTSRTLARPAAVRPLTPELAQPLEAPGILSDALNAISGAAKAVTPKILRTAGKESDRWLQDSRIGLIGPTAMAGPTVAASKLAANSRAIADTKRITQAATRASQATRNARTARKLERSLKRQPTTPARLKRAAEKTKRAEQTASRARLTAERQKLPPKARRRAYRQDRTRRIAHHVATVNGLIPSPPLNQTASLLTRLDNTGRLTSRAARAAALSPAYAPLVVPRIAERAESAANAQQNLVRYLVTGDRKYADRYSRAFSRYIATNR